MKDVSLVTLGMFAFGVSLWLGYGIIIHALPVMLWNALSLSLYITQIILKIRLTARVVSPAATRPPGRTQAALSLS